MAQIFKSKELMFSVPEKETAEDPNCAGGTHYLSFDCTVPCTGTIHTCLCTAHTCTGTIHTCLYTAHTCTCTVHTCTCSYTAPQYCTLATNPPPSVENCPSLKECQMIVDPQDISNIKEVDTLEMLKEKLSSALKDVEGKLKEAKGK